MFVSDLTPIFIDSYRADFNELFVSTEAFIYSADVLNKHHVLVVTGAPGMGKTFMCQQLLLKLYDEKQCEPFQPNAPMEYMELCVPSTRQTFLIDDAFGATSFSQVKYEGWVSMFPKMYHQVMTMNTYIIFVSRQNILKSHITALQNYDIFKYVVNLSDDKFQLTERNKEDIFDNHAVKFNVRTKYQDVKATAELDHHSANRIPIPDPIGYPQCVRMFCSMPDIATESSRTFFQCPMKFLCNLIGSYREDDPLTYCVLVLMFMNDGKLPLQALHPAHKPSDNMMWCLHVCELDDSKARSLRKTADNLCGTFLLVDNDCFVFQHKSIMDAVTFDIGKMYPSDILDRCSLQFFLERVFTRDTAPINTECVITLQPAMFPQMCSRLTQELMKCLKHRYSSQSYKDNTDFPEESEDEYECDGEPLDEFELDSPDLSIDVFSKEYGEATILESADATGLEPEILSISETFDDANNEYDDDFLSRHKTIMLRSLASHPVFRDYAFIRTFLEHLIKTDNLHLLLTSVLRRSEHPTFMFFIALSGQSAVVREIFASFKNKFKETLDAVLYAACNSGSLAAIRVLLAAGAKADCRTTSDPDDVRFNNCWHACTWWGNTRSCTTLMHAGYSGNVEVVNCIYHNLVCQQLDMVKYLNMKGSRSMTSLHWSVKSRGEENMVQFLLDRGADVNVENEWNQTPLHLSVEGGQIAALRGLLKAGADPNAKDDRGQSPLHWGALWGNEDIVRELLDGGADISSVDDQGKTAMHLCASDGNAKTMRVLMNGKVQVNAKDNHGRTALHMAAASGDKDTVSVILQAGADVNSKDMDGRSALHWTALGGKCETSVQILLDKGADINTKDNWGQTSLHLNALMGHEAAVKLLVHMGADIAIRASPSWQCLAGIQYTLVTPFDVAILYNHTRVAEFLRTKML